MRISTIKQSIIKKRFFLLIILGFITIALVFACVYRSKSHARTDAHFQTLTMLASSLNREQASALEVAVSDADIQKICFRQPDIGGGPGGGSYELWCGLSVVRSITVEPDATYIIDLLKRLDRVADQQGMRAEIPPGTNVGYDAIVYSATTADSLFGEEGCTTQVVYTPNGDTPGATADQTTLKYKLSCQAPSSQVIAGFEYLGDR